MNNEERDVTIREMATDLRQISEGVAVIKTHIDLMTPTLEMHGRAIEVIVTNLKAVEVKQQECPARAIIKEGIMPGNRANRMSVIIAAAALTVSIVVSSLNWIVPLLKAALRHP
jgi:hypothetical protein